MSLENDFNEERVVPRRLFDPNNPLHIAQEDNTIPPFSMIRAAFDGEVPGIRRDVKYQFPIRRPDPILMSLEDDPFKEPASHFLEPKMKTRYLFEGPNYQFRNPKPFPGERMTAAEIRASQREMEIYVIDTMIKGLLNEVRKCIDDGSFEASRKRFMLELKISELEREKKLILAKK